MSRVLIVESDAVFAALVEDRLRESGHQVELCGDEDQALAAVARGWSDVVVLDLGLPMAAGGGLVPALRELGEERSCRILALSEPLAPEQRVEVLRAGVDEVLERPVHLEELVLRVDRLGRSGSRDPVVLEGDLASYPLWELLQPLAESRRRGRLLVWNRRGGGALTISDGGRVVAATWETLHGPEALLALLGMEEGNFRFLADRGGDRRVSEAVKEGLEVRRALLEAAWLKDELARRADALPATGEPLTDSGSTLPRAPEPELPELPVREVLERIREQPGTRLFDLLAANLAAPVRVRLAVAWLCEKGVLVPQSRRDEGTAVASTVEIARREVLDAALDELVRVARERGVSARMLPIVLLAERPAWPGLRALFTEVEGAWRPDELPPLLELLASDSGGSCVLAADGGEVALHAQVLDDSSVARLAAIVPACAGAGVWLGPGSGSAPFRKVLERYDLAADGVGFAVASGRDWAEEVRATLAPHPRWSVVPEPPRNLLAVFRMLRGADSARALEKGV